MLSQINKDVLDEYQIIEEEFKKFLSTLRTGRASISILDGIKVDYYGVPTPINQLATISVPESTLIAIQPWDPKIIEDIEKAIRKSNVDINPVSDGKVLKLFIPPLSEERRKEIIKKLKTFLEERKTAIRNIRRKYREIIKKKKDDKEISEDDEQRQYNDLQKSIDNQIDSLEKLYSDKEKHILDD